MVSILSIKSIIRTPENRNVANEREVWEVKNVLGGVQNVQNVVLMEGYAHSYQVKEF